MNELSYLTRCSNLEVCQSQPTTSQSLDIGKRHCNNILYPIIMWLYLCIKYIDCKFKKIIRSSAWLLLSGKSISNVALGWNLGSKILRNSSCFRDAILGHSGAFTFREISNITRRSAGDLLSMVVSILVWFTMHIVYWANGMMPSHTTYTFLMSVQLYSHIQAKG